MTVVHFDPTRSSEETQEDIREESTAPAGIRVILADSQAIYRVGMRKVFALEDDIRVVAQVTETDEANTVELYRRGVRGVVPRSISPDLLIKCVRKIAEGETWIDNQSISWVIEAYRSQATTLTDPRVQPKLSKKELAIIGCITRGMRNKEIAYQIGTTEQVIKNYLRKVYDKLGVSDRLELALYCLHHELLKKYPQEADNAVGAHTEPSQPLRAKM